MAPTRPTAPANPLPGPDLLYDAAPCGLLLADAAGVVVHANLTLAHMLRYERAELVGMKFTDLLSVGARIFHQTHLQPLLRMQGSVAEVKLEWRCKDGKVLPMMQNMAERPGEGGPLLHVAAFVIEDRHRYERQLLEARRQAEALAALHAKDQSDLAAAQSRLRLALEAANLFAWEVDPQTGTRRYEEGAARLLGYSGPLQLDAQAFLDAIDPEDRERELEAFSSALRGGSDTYSCTYRLHGRDGVVRTVTSAGRPFFDTSGRLVHFVGVLQEGARQA